MNFLLFYNYFIRKICKVTSIFLSFTVNSISAARAPSHIRGHSCVHVIGYVLRISAKKGVILANDERYVERNNIAYLLCRTLIS